MTTLTKNNRKTWYFRVFRFSIFIANVTIDFHHLNLFRFYWKYLNIILSLVLYSLRKNEFLYSNKLLPFNMKSINPIKKYPFIKKRILSKCFRKENFYVRWKTKFLEYWILSISGKPQISAVPLGIQTEIGTSL